jgi:predicted dehydrogenase
LIAICDSDAARLHAWHAFLPAIAKKTATFEHLLKCADVDAIVLATPPETHARLALRALSANKHVFVEKPMALSSIDAHQLRRLARERHLRLMIGHVLLYHPAVRELAARLRLGELGELQAIHCVRMTSSRRRHRETAWWSLAPHDVSLVQRLFGRPPHEIEARHCATERGELIAARLAFAGGAIATIRVGVDQFSDVRRMLVVGTNRAALFDDRAADEKLRLFSSARGAWTLHPYPAARGPYDVPALPAQEPLALEVQHFIDAILDGGPILSDAAEGCAVVAALEAGQSSLAQQGKPAMVDARNHPGAVTSSSVPASR